jgi:hypothetical protein
MSGGDYNLREPSPGTFSPSTTALIMLMKPDFPFR